MWMSRHEEKSRTLEHIVFRTQWKCLKCKPLLLKLGIFPINYSSDHLSYQKNQISIYCPWIRINSKDKKYSFTAHFCSISNTNPTFLFVKTKKILTNKTQYHQHYVTASTEFECCNQHQRLTALDCAKYGAAPSTKRWS